MPQTSRSLSWWSTRSKWKLQWKEIFVRSSGIFLRNVFLRARRVYSKAFLLFASPTTPAGSYRYRNLDAPNISQAFVAVLRGIVFVVKHTKKWLNSFLKSLHASLLERDAFCDNVILRKKINVQKTIHSCKLFEQRVWLSFSVPLNLKQVSLGRREWTQMGHPHSFDWESPPHFFRIRMYYLVSLFLLHFLLRALFLYPCQPTHFPEHVEDLFFW